MDVAGDEERDRADARALLGRRRQQRRRRMLLVEVLDDRQRLRDRLVAVDERRDRVPAD
jgi:hypothetical protein